MENSFIATPITVKPSLVKLVESTMKHRGISEEQAARFMFGNSEYYEKWLEEKKASNA